MSSDKDFDEKSALDFTKNAMYVYGASINEDRALPDARDGLKPSQRRVLWAMYKIGLTDKSRHVKSARIVGETIGKYHPHGDGSAYQTLVNMTQQYANQPLVDGEGNFGTQSDPPASMRYTNARLTRYAMKYMLDPGYIEVIDKVPNFDDSEVEPLILPALVPNLLVNGTTGIGLGLNSVIPSFQLEGVIKLVKHLLTSGEKASYNVCKKYLKFGTQGGGIVDQDEDKEEIKSIFLEGKGKIEWLPKVVENKSKGTVKIIGFPPFLDLEKAVGNIAEDKELISKIEDLSSIEEGGFAFLAHIRPNLCRDTKTWNESVYEVMDYFANYQSVKCNVTHRIANNETQSGYEVSFYESSVVDILNSWIDWRIQLEIDYLKLQKSKLKQELRRQGVLEFAFLNRDAIYKIITSSNDPLRDLQSKLDLSEEDAKVIWELKIRQLSKLDGTVVQDKISDLKSQIAKLKLKLKKPAESVVSQLESLD